MIKNFFILAVQNILHRRLRSWLTVIGILIGITAIVALISFGLGLERTIAEQMEGMFGHDTFLLFSGAHAFAPPPPHAEGGAQIDLALVRRVRGVAAAETFRSETGFVQGPATVEAEQVQGFFPIAGLSPELVRDFDAFVGEITVAPGGRLFTHEDRYQIILGNILAADLHVRLGAVVRIEDRPFEVIGILNPSPEMPTGGAFGGGPMHAHDDMLFIPAGMLEELFGPSVEPLPVFVRVEEGFEIAAVAEQVVMELDAAGMPASTMIADEIAEIVGTVIRAVRGFLAGIAAIALLVGAVGVMNTMFTSVLERRKEIGVMKAVGAKRGHIMFIFLIESGLMGLVGGLIGAGLGVGLSAMVMALVRRFFDIELMTVISPGLIIGTLFFAFLLGALAGLLPARRAAKLSPVDALRYE